MAKPRLTAQQVEYLVAEYERGRTCPNIGAELGLHPVSVLNYLKKKGVQRRPPGVAPASADLLEAAKQLRGQGLLWKVVEARVGLTTNTLLRHLRHEQPTKAEP